MTPDPAPSRPPTVADGRSRLRALARSKWAIVAGGVILLVGAWTVARLDHGGGTKPAAAEEKGVTKEGSSSDSLVTLDSASLRNAGIELARAAEVGSAALTANGTITFDANRSSVVAPRAEGRVITMQADLGMHVGRGSVLAILESADVGQARGELERARATLEAAQKNHERERRLFDQMVSSQKELLEAEAAFRTARAEFEGAMARLSGLGARGGRGGTYELVSPVAGSVVERNGMPGQVVGPTTTLFTVADLSRVWITVDVYESDAARVRRGTPAIVTPRALSGQEFRGRVTYAGETVDTATRTVRVRVELSNPQRRLRPGMFASVRFETLAEADPAARLGAVVPDVAVQDVGGASVVFVPGRIPGQFIMRRVTVAGPPSGGMVTLASGVRPRDRVVVAGAFQLKSELLKGSFKDVD